MIYTKRDGKAAPREAVETAARAAAEFAVPVGVLLATVECESDFRPDAVSSAGAVGPCQFLPGYKADYYRYAGFEFDLTSWESVRGLAAVYRFYYSLAEERYGYAGADGWRYALLAHRYGQNSRKAKELDTSVDRIRDAEEMMRRNGLWYDTDDEKGEEPMLEPEKTAKAAAKWALSKVGCRYSQAERTKKDVFDCSSLVARAYSAQGVDWDLVGSEVPNSTQEVYSDQFLLLWPESYEEIGKTLGGRDVLKKAARPGDLQFLCTDSDTKRSNRITHVAMVSGKDEIVHARSTKYGVRTDDLDLSAGKVCAVARFDPRAPLRRGMRGLRVKALQELLNEQGAKLETDGIFGPATEKAADKYGVG